MNDIKKNYPACIEHLYCQYLEETISTRKMELMTGVFRYVIQYIGCIFLSEYLWSDEKSSAAVNGSIKRLSRPSLGSWYDFVEKYNKEYCRKNDSWLEGFNECFKDINDKNVEEIYVGRFRNKKTDKMNVFREMISLRNRIAHGASYPEEKEAEDILKIYSKYLEKILSSLEPFFKRYKIYKCVSYDDYDEETKQDCWIGNFIEIDVDGKEINNKTIRWDKDEPCFNDGLDPFLVVNDYYLIDCEKENRIFKFSSILIDYVNNENDQDEDFEDEYYYMYNGYGNKYVNYIGIKNDPRIEKYIDQIRTKFSNRGVSLSFDKDNFNIQGFRSYTNELTQISIENMIISQKYNRDIYIERACDEELEDFIDSDKTTVLISAQAGAGKTTLICRFMERLIDDKEKYAVYYINANNLENIKVDKLKDSVYDRVVSELFKKDQFNNFKDILDFVNQNNEEGIKVVFVIDAINESSNAVGILKEINDVTSECGNYPWLRFILTIRSENYRMIQDYYINDDGNNHFVFAVDKHRFYQDNNGNAELIVEPLNAIETLELYDRYTQESELEIDQIPSFLDLNNDLQNILSSPLNMRLYFEVLSLSNKSNINNEFDLFENRINSLITNKYDKSLTILQNIVDKMYDEKTNYIDRDKAEELDDFKREKHNYTSLSPLEKLIDRGFIYDGEIETDNGVLKVMGFVLQKFLEYMLYKRIKNYSVDEIIDEMLKSYKWQSLPEQFLACEDAIMYSDYNLSAIEKILDRCKDYEIEKHDLKSTITSIIIDGISKIKDKENRKNKITRYIEILKDNDLIIWLKDVMSKLLLKGDPEGVEELIDQLLLIENLPMDFMCKVYFNKAMICQNRSQNSKAIEYFETALKNETDNDEKNRCLIQLAKTYRKERNIDKAIEIIDGILDGSENNFKYADEALIQRGLIKVYQKDYVGALNDYIEALKISRIQKDNFNIAYNLLGIQTAFDNMSDSEKKAGNYEDIFDRNYVKEKEEIDINKQALLECYGICVKNGYINLLSDCLHGLSIISYDEAKYMDAQNYMKQAILLAERSKHIEGLTIMYVILALARIHINEQNTNEFKIDDYMHDINKAIEYRKHVRVDNDAIRKELLKYKEEIDKYLNGSLWLNID